MMRFFAVLKKITGRDVVRPDIAGAMGAFGAALIAKDNHMEDEVSTILTSDMLDGFKVDISSQRCGLCENRCLLTINKFQMEIDLYQAIGVRGDLEKRSRFQTRQIFMTSSINVCLTTLH